MEVHQLEPKPATGRYPLNPKHQHFFPRSSGTTTATTAITNANNGLSLQGQNPECKCGITEGLAVVFMLLLPAIIVSLPFVLIKLDHLYVQPQCAIDSVTLYPFNVSSSHITANWNITFIFEGDPYHSSNYYLHDVRASVFYKDKNISSTMIRPVSANIEHKVEANFGVNSAYLNSSIGEAMLTDWSLGAVKFNIKVNALVRRIDYESNQDETKPMSVLCEDVIVGFSSDMKTPWKLMGGLRKCK